MEKFLPKVYELFNKVDYRPEMYATRWFMNIFVGDFPIETVVRIWDIFLEEGRIIVYKVAMAYLTLLEPKILKENSMEGMFMLFKNDAIVDTEALLKTATHFDFTVDPILKWEEEFEANVHGSSFEFVPYGYTCAMDSLKLQPWMFPGEEELYMSTKQDSISFKDENQKLK